MPTPPGYHENVIKLIFVNLSLEQDLESAGRICALDHNHRFNAAFNASLALQGSQNSSSSTHSFLQLYQRPTTFISHAYREG